jgi:cell fate (sporulation/competence/biofilm development) regulator YlbF (YheA/YmcA/DUF963 family)
MKPVELAKQLAKSLAESVEYQNYQKAKAKVEEHEAAKVMLDDFRKKQWDYERKKAGGEKNLEPLEEELRKLSGVVGLNPFVRDYLMAEYQFSQILMEVQRIIGEGVGLKMPDSIQNGGETL